MTTILFLLSLLALSQAQQQQSGCSFQSTRTPYTLSWIVDPSSQNVLFNLTYRNFPQGSFTGVGFGNNMASGLDVILVSLPVGSSTPQVVDASVKGYTSPTRNTNSEVQTRSVSYNGGTLSAQFIRPIVASNGARALSNCVTWNFISSPGAAYANGTYGRHSATPEQQQQCNLASRCAGTIPAQFLSTPNNGAWSSSQNSNSNNNAFYSPYQNNQNQYQQQQFNTQQQNQQYGQPQQFNNQYQNQQFGQYQQPQGQFPAQIGSGAGMTNQQQQPFYSPYGNQNQASNQYGRKKRQANTNIYGYNYDSSAAGGGPLLVQNPNYQFLPNNLADEYARTYSQISAQYDAQRGGVGGVQRDGSTQATQHPVLNNQQQNERNYQQIQRDTASGAYSTIAPATNIYGYAYDTPSSSGFTTQRPPTTTFNPSSRQFDASSNPSASARDQSLQRFYNPGVTSAGNVYTGSLYNGGAATSSVSASSTASNSNTRFFNPPTTTGTNTNGRLFDASGSTANSGVVMASANRGPQPGQQIFYDPSTFGRKKRSTPTIRARRQVRFYDPGNNQSAMYYPYRTETDFNLNAGQQGFSQVGGSTNNVQYSAPQNGVNGATEQRFYDTSRGVYVDTVPQFDSRGGNQYLKTAPVNPQSANFVQTLQNNARALNDYVDASCSKTDPYWCDSYVKQILAAQNSFGSYSSGLCSTLVASLQYSDNRCCNAVRAAGCQS